MASRTEEFFTMRKSLRDSHFEAITVVSPNEQAL